VLFAGGLPVVGAAVALLALVAVVNFAWVEVTIDERHVQARSVIGWSTQIRLDRIREARVVDVQLSGPYLSGRSLHGLPFVGWSGRVIRGGEAVSIALDDGRSYTVSVDGAADAADALARLGG